MITLAQALYALPTSRLKALVEYHRIDPKRMIHLTDKRQMVQFLATELSRGDLIRASLGLCDARQLRLLQLLVICHEGQKYIAWSKVLRLAGGDHLRGAIASVLQGLTHLGMAFEVDGEIYLAPSIAQQIPISLSDRYQLAQCLGQYDAPALRQISGQLGLRTPLSTKAAVAQAIQTYLLQPKLRDRLHSPLSPQENEVLDYLMEAGGFATPIELAKDLMPSKVNEFFQYGWNTRWRQGQARNPIDHLLARGLVYVVSVNYGFNSFLVIPGDLLRVLSPKNEDEFWGQAAPTLRSHPGSLVGFRGNNSLVRDVTGFLGFLATQEAARTNTGIIHRTSLKNATRLLGFAHEDYALFLYSLCRQAELIAPQGEKQVYRVTKTGMSWLTMSALDQIRILFEAWRDGTLWKDMYVDPLAGSSEQEANQASVHIRLAALRAVTEASVTGEWMDLHSLAEVLAFRHPLLMAQGLEEDEEESILPSPVHFAMSLVGTSLLVMGCVEIGLEEKPTPLPAASAPKAKSGGRQASPAPEPATAEVNLPVAFRLTPLGVYLLQIGDAPLPPEEPREDKFILQANAEILLTPYLEPAVRYRLMTLTEAPKNGTGNSVNLTKESIRRALDQGETVREVLAFLQAHSRTGIPQNVEYLINEVGGKHGHIHIGKAQMYLQTDSALLMKELQARRELKDYFVRTLGDTVAILKTDDPEKMLKELRKAGYLPISDDTAPARVVAPKTTTPAKSTAPEKTPLKPVPSVAWEKLAQEDGKPWGAGSTGQVGMPADATRGSGRIASLMLQAARRGQQVEIAYLEPGQKELTVDVILPLRASGNFVTAHSQSYQEERYYNTYLIQWARLL